MSQLAEQTFAAAASSDARRPAVPQPMHIQQQQQPLYSPYPAMQPPYQHLPYQPPASYYPYYQPQAGYQAPFQPQQPQPVPQPVQPTAQPPVQPAPVQPAPAPPAPPAAGPLNPADYPTPKESQAKRQRPPVFQRDNTHQIRRQEPVSEESLGTYRDNTSCPMDSKDEDGFTFPRRRQHRQLRRQPQEEEEPEVPLLVEGLPEMALDNLPGNFSEDDDAIRYYLDDEPAVVFRSRRRPDHRRSSQQLHPGAVLITDNSHNPRLPVPSNDLPYIILANVDYLLRPKLKRNILHQENGQQCHCVQIETVNIFHRPSVLVDVCLQKEFLKPTFFTIGPNSTELQFRENPNRVFSYCHISQRHVLSIPQPFLISQKWPSRPYLPKYANCNNRKAKILFFKLYEPIRFCSIAEQYLNTPDQWETEKHAYFGEPSQGDELFFSNSGFGLETSFRTSFVTHPCRDENIDLFPMMDPNTFVIPQMKTSNKFDLDNCLSTTLRPFYSDGVGKIICAICIFRTRSDSFVPELLSKSEFVKHYQSRHWNHSIVSGLHSATQMHSRVYSCHFLYVLCLAHPGVDSKPDLSPIDKKALSNFQMSENPILSCLAQRPQARNESFPVTELVTVPKKKQAI